jgi:galactokinase
VLTAYLLISDFIKTEQDRIDLAMLSKRVENEFIGVQCGIMDQFSIAMGREGHAILLNSETLDYEYVPVRLKDHIFVIMNTNKPRQLSDSKFNERRGECEKALEYIREKRDILHLADAHERDLDLVPDETLRKRARHVITENSRVLQSVELLKRDDIPSFGEMMSRSHYSLRHDYEVSGFELDTLVEAAMKVPGCQGARMTGAGFGGCAIALVEKEAKNTFNKTVAEQYRESTGLAMEFYESEPCEGVREEK